MHMNQNWSMVDWDTWYYAPGNPPVTHSYDTSLSEQILPSKDFPQAYLSGQNDGRTKRAGSMEGTPKGGFCSSVKLEKESKSLAEQMRNGVAKYEMRMRSVTSSTVDKTVVCWLAVLSINIPVEPKVSAAVRVNTI
eukprot:1161404-Pelagomonas_calceolata.AAC.10